LSTISSYLKDVINIIALNTDVWGVSTETVNSGVAARIEDRNELIKNQDGKEVVGEMLIVVDPAIDINYDDRIQIVSRNGETTDIPNKKFAIQRMSKAHGFKLSHWEVWL